MSSPEGLTVFHYQQILIQAKISGHVENSRAFARYRDIDDEMIREMTELL